MTVPTTGKTTPARKTTNGKAALPALASFQQIMVPEKDTKNTVRSKATVFPADLGTLYVDKATYAKYVPGKDPESLHLRVTVEFLANED